ncbi:hypothetical protein QJS10_CPA16g01498 [Acorus calamus]|uniref:Uncharacterized protein n=1 Tax=Acorus calamus TaxID=4465 RepID=A0AAV9D1U8_ACOCL|nr:hypothetical protein QJS10_CPA16g01498 [Acorus calamus]
MADLESSPSPQVTAPLSSSKENQTPISAKIADLNESKSELLTRIQSLKQDMQNWRSKLDTQVKGYRNEISELKKTLNVEVEQLRTEFQELKSTLQQQQEEVTTSLKNLGIQDAPEDTKETETPPRLQMRLWKWIPQNRISCTKVRSELHFDQANPISMI